MTRMLAISDTVLEKLARGAAQRGLTVEGLLAFMSELVVLPERASEQARQRSERIEQMLAHYAAGQLTAADGAMLDRLIEEDYEDAIAHADRLIAAQPTGPSRAAPKKQRRARVTAKPSKQPRK